MVTGFSATGLLADQLFKPGILWRRCNNNSYFEIKSGSNGKDFSLKGKVNTSANEAVQDFTNYNVTNTYYRLKQVNADNSFTYGNVIFIKINKMNALRIYPMLVSQQITVETTSDENIKVYDTNGKFMQKLMPGNNDISKLAPGMYFVTDETKNVVQFIKQ